MYRHGYVVMVMIKMDTQTCVVLCVLIIFLILSVTWIKTVRILGEDKCFCETLETPVAGIVREKSRYCVVV